MRFRLIFKSFDGKDLFPAKHITLAEVNDILEGLNGSFGCMEDTIAAIKPYSVQQKQLVLNVPYQNLTGAFLFGTFRERSTRTISVNPTLAKEITFKDFVVNDDNTISYLRRLKQPNVVIAILCNNRDKWVIK